MEERGSRAAAAVLRTTAVFRAAASVANPSSAPPLPPPMVPTSSTPPPSSVPPPSCVPPLPPPSCAPSRPPPCASSPPPLAGGSNTVHDSLPPPPTSHRCPVHQIHPQRKEAAVGHVEQGRRQPQRKPRPKNRRERAPRREKQVVGSSPAVATVGPIVGTEATTSQAQDGEVLSSVSKHNASIETHERVSGSKRIRSPIVSLSVRSPGIRILLSPRISSSPSPSPSPSAMQPRKYRRRRKLTSKIWNDFEAIYDGDTVSKAECIHCHKRIKVARDVGTSTCRRHLRSCEGKARLDQITSQMNLSDLSIPDESLKDWKFDQEKSQKELVSLIVVHALVIIEAG